MATTTPSFYTLPVARVAVGESVRVYSGFESLDQELGLALSALLVSRLRSGKLSGLSLVEAVMLCLTAAVPDLSTHLSQLTTLNVIPVAVTPDDADAYVSANYRGAGGLGSSAMYPEPLPGAVVVNSLEGVYAGIASILFGIGKSSSPGPESAAVKARPLALINRFKIAGDSVGLLPGKEYGPTSEALADIYSVFSTYSEPRMKVVQYFLAVGLGGGHMTKPMEIVMTNFRLMRGAGMTHVEAINKLMRMHPWTLRVPELAPYYTRFAAELRKFAVIPEEVRNYHRLLVPQSEFLFVSAEYRPLVAVAGSYIKDVETSFSGYMYGAEQFAGLIAKVRRYAPSKSQYVGTGTLAAALGVQDMQLPPLGDADQPGENVLG